MIAALGVAYTKNPVQPPSPVPSISACHYHNGGLSLTVKTETSDKEGFEKTKSALSGGEVVPGVGEAAYFHATQNMSIVVGSFVALKGRTLLTLNYGGIGVSQDKALAAEKALATRLLAKL
jgi:hypothetical protein